MTFAFRRNQLRDATRQNPAARVRRHGRSRLQLRHQVVRKVTKLLSLIYTFSYVNGYPMGHCVQRKFGCHSWAIFSKNYDKLLYMEFHECFDFEFPRH